MGVARKHSEQTICFGQSNVCHAHFRILSGTLFPNSIRKWAWLIFDWACCVDQRVAVLHTWSGVYSATNWLPFDGSQNSIFRLSFKLDLSLIFFYKSKMKFYNSRNIFYLIHIEKVSRNCWKIQSFPELRDIYMWLIISWMSPTMIISPFYLQIMPYLFDVMKQIH